MKKAGCSALLVLTACISTNIWANSDQVVLNQALKNPVAVERIKTLPDDTGVLLTGTLIKHLNQDYYEFSDETGLILLEIDDDLWKASQVRPGDKVQVLGEVDTHRYKPTNVDVLNIEKISTE